jgi:carboxyl-terminal processing protease
VNGMLQAKPGGTVRIRLNRKGWLHPYELALVQKEGAPGSTVHKMLPGGVGYLRLTIFDNTLEGSVKRALKYLKDQGMKGLILDLRDNPGGMLPAAVAVADMFIKDGRLMTTTFNRYAPQFPVPGFKEIAEMMGAMKQGEEKFTAHVATDYEDRESASASEMLSGALQDDGRAILVGEKTYGKGVGQTAVPLWKTGFPPGRFLYLTVMKYYLPGGRCINHVGIPPDIKQPAGALSGEVFDGAFDLRTGGALEKYIEQHYAADPKLFYDKDTKKGLAVYDGFDCSMYPGFDAWFAGLDTKLSRDQVREQLRRAIRARVQKDHKFAFACDLQTDQQLQRAVVEIRKMLGGPK